MSPEAQRIAIARATGWHEIMHCDYSGRFQGGVCTWPAHIIEKIKAEDAKRTGWTGYPPGTKERLERERRMRSGLPNVAYYVEGGELEREKIPDYPADLNAMGEAEKVLPDADVRTGAPDKPQFRFHLGEICGTRAICHATASQRAEAFLRTLSMWDGAK